MTAEKSFYDFNVESLQERKERNSLYPELALFHIALREELRDDEYQAFFNAEKESFKQAFVQNKSYRQKWVQV